MTKTSRNSRGASTVSLLIGTALLAVSITGALQLMGVSMHAQQNQNSENLVDQVNRIGEIITVHLNRGGSNQNLEVAAKGIQLCSLQNNSAQCNGYVSGSQNFCLSVPSRISQGGQDVITLTGFRLFQGVLAQREMPNANMSTFDHGDFCKNNGAWLNLNNVNDFKFTTIRFCRFKANSPQQVTKDYEQNCDSVIENNPTTSMFWVAILKAKMGTGPNENQYEEARIVHLLNTPRVRTGS